MRAVPPSWSLIVALGACQPVEVSLEGRLCHEGRCTDGYVCREDTCVVDVGDLGGRGDAGTDATGPDPGRPAGEAAVPEADSSASSDPSAAADPGADVDLPCGEACACELYFGAFDPTLPEDDTAERLLSVTLQVDACSWSALSDSPSWLATRSIDSTTVGIKPLTANTGRARIGRIVAGNRVVAVVQVGPNAPVMTDAVDPVVRAYADLALARNYTELCRQDQFCPGDSVTGREAARWLVNVLAPGEPLNVAPNGPFTDVPEGDLDQGLIQWVKDHQLPCGCWDGSLGSDSFCPDTAMTRLQAARMVVRAMSLSWLGVHSGQTPSATGPEWPVAVPSGAIFGDLMAGESSFNDLQRMGQFGISLGTVSASDGSKVFGVGGLLDRVALAAFMVRAFAH